MSGLLALSATFMQPAQAAPTAAQVQQIRDNSYRVVTQSFMFVILEKAKERQADVRSRVQTLDTQVAALGDADASRLWKAVRQSAMTDLYLKGDVDQLKIYGLEDSATEFVRDLDRLMPRDIPREQKALYDLAQRMQVMMTIYLRNNADPLGGSNYSGVNREIAVENLPDEFDAALKAALKSSPKLAPAIAKIRPKWVFLAPRLRDFNQKSVPYLVDMYGRQIIDNLLASAAEIGAPKP